MKSSKSDLFRLSGIVSFRSFIKGMSSSPGFKFLLFFRLSKRYSRYSFFGFFFYQLYKHYSIKYGYQIPRSVDIGEGLALPHYGGIVINSNAIIGKNCNILHGVTIGNNRSGKTSGTPRIGNFVYIGPGAVVVGGVVIGDNVLIAPNSFVNFDVPNNSIVLGNPAKFLYKLNPSTDFILNPII